MKKWLFQNRFLVYTLLWFVFLIHFILGKVIFFLYNYKEGYEYRLTDLLQSISNGLKIDFSTIGYIMVLPTLFYWISTVFKNKKSFTKIIEFYLLGVGVISTLLIYIDIHLFKYWGQKVDLHALSFLKNPAGIFISLKLDVLIPIFLFLIHSYLLIIILKKISLYLQNEELQERSWKQFSSFFVVASLIFLPIRGGVNLVPEIHMGIPINISDVYFSSEDYLNQTAINVTWFLGFSFDKEEVKYSFYENKKSHKIVEELLKIPINQRDTLLKVDKPNVVLILLESFTANAVGSLGGEINLTPNLNKLSEEGILFTSFYANAMRSDKGNASILTGHPSFPDNTILHFPQRMNKLPYLPLHLEKEGYTSSYLYGGDMNFFNFNILMKKAGFDKVLSKSDFSASEISSKWGVPDHITFEKLYTELNQKREKPIFQVLFTLSSHSPFDLPVAKKFGSETIDDEFRSSVFYTDSCLGTFIEKAKKEEWWKNTLFIVMADHGVDNLSTESIRSPAKYKIPMLWLGGAIKEQKKINHIGSQMDFSKTLLNQLNIDATAFRFSKDICNPSSPEFAYYSSSTGIGFLNKKDTSFFHLSGLSEQYRNGKFTQNNALCEEQKSILQELSIFFFDE